MLAVLAANVGSHTPVTQAGVVWGAADRRAYSQPAVAAISRRRARGVSRVTPKLRLAIVTALAAVAIVGCRGSSGGSASPTARPTQSPTYAAATTLSTSASASPTTSPVVSPAAPTTPGAADVAPTQTPVDQTPALCASGAEVAPAATVAADDLVELSGLAASGIDDGVYWAHNDSGDTARIFAMDTNGASLATYTLAGADAIDWEDIAIGADASRDASEIYVGDIGDNGHNRPNIVIYRLREPAINRSNAPTVATLDGVQRLTFTYPDGPHDAETLMIDNVSGDLIIVTKDAAGSEIFRAPGTLDAGSTFTLEIIGRIDFSQRKQHVELPPDAPLIARAGGAFATGGDISAAGDLIAIRTYSAVWLWTRAPGQSIAAALAAAPCEGPSAAEQQGEAIAFERSGAGYVTSSEGAHPPLHRFEAP